MKNNFSNRCTINLPNSNILPEPRLMRRPLHTPGSVLADVPRHLQHLSLSLPPRSLGRRVRATGHILRRIDLRHRGQWSQRRGAGAVHRDNLCLERLRAARCAG